MQKAKLEIRFRNNQGGEREKGREEGKGRKARKEEKKERKGGRGEKEKK